MSEPSPVPVPNVTTDVSDRVELSADAKAAPTTAYRAGERLVMTEGDIPELRADEAIVGERSAAGVECRAEGGAYVALGGPHKGELIQQIREEATGALMAAPVSRLRSRETAGHSRPRLGWERRYAESFDRVFGGADRHEPAGRWVEVSPGRMRLVRE